MTISRQSRLLAVRLSSLGDLVHTIPVVPALRETFPDAQIDWLVDSRWSPLMELVRGIDEVIPLRSSVSGYMDCMRRVRASRYSCVIDFQGIHRSAMLAWVSGAERRIGRDRNSARERGAAKFYTERVSPTGKHVAEMSISLAVRAGARVPERMQFPITVPVEEVNRIRERMRSAGVERFVVVSPGGGWKSKCWPADRFGALCAEIWERHRMRSVVNVGPREEELGNEVLQHAGQAQPIVYCPTLRELVALLSRAVVVVGADTGPLHLAAALGTRAVALFGSTSAARNGPLPSGVVVQNQTSCLENYRRGDYARGRSHSSEMLSITVEQALAAVEEQISRFGSAAEVTTPHTLR